MDIDFEVHPQDVQCTIRTDGGKEFTDQKFKETVNKHQYHQEITGADALSQNGMAEQPHCTIKEKIQCMLYSARLGT